MAAVRFGKDTRVKFVGGQLHVRFDGNDVLVQELQGLQRRALNLITPFKQFAKVWFRSNKEMFDAEGLPEQWEGLAPRYERWKALHYPGKSILRREDRLYQSLTGNTRDTIYEANPRSLKIGTRVPYSPYLQEGTDNMPARPHVLIQEEAFARLSEITMDYILGGGGFGRRVGRRG